ncbi:hypothetical protein NC651_013066 [Populus alba x Populus x berolinensis]|nr:hypothetical protein NC651_013066 [Populus alba x Populus x berolinensis]
MGHGLFYLNLPCWRQAKASLRAHSSDLKNLRQRKWSDRRDIPPKMTVYVHQPKDVFACKVQHAMHSQKNINFVFFKNNVSLKQMFLSPYNSKLVFI